MRRMNDEILMAYADGALPEADLRHVEAALRRDAGARRMVAVFRYTAVLARHAFDAPLLTDPPGRLVAAVGQSRARSGDPFTWSGWITGWFGFGGMVAAASLASLVAVGALVWPQAATRLDAVPSGISLDRVAVGSVPAGSELAHVLDGLAGQARRPLDRRFTLIATLADKWGNSCQEVDARARVPDGPPAFVFVACRSQSGEWNVVGAVSPVIEARGGQRADYARSEAMAHEALASVLSMIGARQRATALKPETKQQ